MIRVTNQMLSNNLVSTLNRQKAEMQSAEQNLATGKRIQNPSDDPAAASSQMMLRSRRTELEQYERNVVEARDRLNLIDGQMQRVTDILQRARVLSVQAANGVYTELDRREAVAREINQHLKALIEVANAKDATGRNLFAGSVLDREAFLPVYAGNLQPGADDVRAITGVRYQGDINVQQREIERFETMDITLPGNRIFWGTNMSVSSNRDSSGYTAAGNQSFEIDGVEIEVAAGDTLDDIIDKINNAPLEVKASKGAMDDLILTSETPHQIWLDDLKGGTVLQDLGLIDGNSPMPPNNYAQTATVTGQSVFDVLITLRDDLINNDVRSIGGRDLEALDASLENLLRYQTETGARVNRIELHQKRIAWDQNYTTQLLAENESVDVHETIMNLKWLENVHQYALNVGAKIIKPTLMDFLR